MSLTGASTLLRRNVFDPVYKLTDLEATVTAVHGLRRCWLPVATDACAVFGSWPNWACHKTTTAIWADITERTVDTARAEGTFVTADTRLLGIGR